MPAVPAGFDEAEGPRRVDRLGRARAAAAPGAGVVPCAVPDPAVGAGAEPGLACAVAGDGPAG